MTSPSAPTARSASQIAKRGNTASSSPGDPTLVSKSSWKSLLQPSLTVVVGLPASARPARPGSPPQGCPATATAGTATTRSRVHRLRRGRGLLPARPERRSRVAFRAVYPRLADTDEGFVLHTPDPALYLMAPPKKTIRQPRSGPCPMKVGPGRFTRLLAVQDLFRAIAVRPTPVVFWSQCSVAG